MIGRTSSDEANQFQLLVPTILQKIQLLVKSNQEQLRLNFIMFFATIFLFSFKSGSQTWRTILISSVSLNPDSDPYCCWIRILFGSECTRILYDKIKKKYTTENFLIGNRHISFLKHLHRTFRLRDKPPALTESSSNMKFLRFYLFWGKIFGLAGSGSVSTDRIESGSSLNPKHYWVGLFFCVNLFRLFQMNFGLVLSGQGHCRHRYLWRAHRKDFQFRWHLWLGRGGVILTTVA